MSGRILSQKNNYIIPLILLTLFLIVGLLIFKDYNVSTDEPIQIQAGHVIWRYICLKFGFPVPDAIAHETDLHGFKNSFYGQAATFPTVVIESLNGFRLDSSTIIRIRHLWNFITFFIGLSLFSFMLYKIYENWLQSALGILLMVLLPRIFGDIFYNDRDVMLISWMMIAISAFYWVVRKQSFLSILACGAAFGMAFNTRIFGLSLLIFPALFFVFTKQRLKYVVLVISAMAFWFVFSPIAWENPIQTIPEAFVHLATQQRSIDTLDGAQLLFFGKLINETKLPWYYIPLYILVTTPVMTTLSALLGIAVLLYQIFSKRSGTRVLLSAGMFGVLVTVQLVGIIFHLTFYDGWRHFYFLYLPLIWLAVEGITYAVQSANSILRYCTVIFMGMSFICSLIWIIQVHPYQITYMNPFFRIRWAGQFTRDFWVISSKEAIEYLLSKSENIAIHVTDNHYLESGLLGFTPDKRERFHTYPYKTQPYPIEYLYFHYTNETGNDKQFDYYIPIYSIERDGIKLSEVFQRSHFLELDGPEIIESITADSSNLSVFSLIDGDYETVGLDTGRTDVLTIKFKGALSLSGFEIFPKENLAEYPKFTLYCSENGDTWTKLLYTRKGTNGIGLSFPQTAYLQIRFDEPISGIREILFYGDPAVR